MLAQRGLHGYAIEPSKGMSDQRPAFGPAVERFEWTVGSPEETGPPDASVTGSAWEPHPIGQTGSKQRLQIIWPNRDGAHQTGPIRQVLSIAMPHYEAMTAPTYLEMWRSYHDVPSQIGSERWGEILKPVLDRVAGKTNVITLHHTHAWTGRSIWTEPKLMEA